MKWKNLSSALNCSVFPVNRELFGNESNKKLILTYYLCFVCFVSVVFISLWKYTPIVTYM